MSEKLALKGVPVTEEWGHLGGLIQSMKDEVAEVRAATKMDLKAARKARKEVASTDSREEAEGIRVYATKEADVAAEQPDAGYVTLCPGQPTLLRERGPG